MSRASEFVYVLPGTWLSLPLSEDSEVNNRNIRTLVERTVGRGDNRAQLRHELRQRLTAVAVQSRVVKAEELHIAQTLVGPAPFPATLTISRPGVAIPHGETMQQTVETMLRLMPGDDPVAVDNEQLAVVRSVARHPATATSSTPDLMVNYWIETPATFQLTIFTFSTPLLDLEDPLLKLFDAIILTVRPRATASSPTSAS